MYGHIPQLVDETPSIRVTDLREYIREVARTGREITGTVTLHDRSLDLMIAKEDETIQLILDDSVILLDSEPSHLVPGTVGRWYFVCPQCGRRSGALYLPTPNSQFACRVCHNLAYRRSSDRESTLLRRVAEHCGMDPILLKALADAMRSRQ